MLAGPKGAVIFSFCQGELFYLVEESFAFRYVKGFLRISNQG